MFEASDSGLQTAAERFAQRLFWAREGDLTDTSHPVCVFQPNINTSSKWTFVKLDGSKATGPLPAFPNPLLDTFVAQQRVLGMDRMDNLLTRNTSPQATSAPRMIGK